MTAPNWVKARAECTMEQNFGVVADQIRKDVGKFNVGFPL